MIYNELLNHWMKPSQPFIIQFLKVFNVNHVKLLSEASSKYS